MTYQAEPIVTTEGQPAADSTPSNAPVSKGTTSGQKAAPTVKAEATTQKAEPATEESPQFYDPKEVPPELQGAFKRMQASYTKAVQKANSYKSKVEAYDEFYKDPVASIQRIAAQNGYTLTKAEAKAIANEQKQQAFQPQTWDDVLSEAERRAAEKAKAELLKELQPVIGEFKNIKQSQIETQLDEAFPEWRTYEDEMAETLNKHPTLANDPQGLIRMAVPQEVWQARAAQEALKKLQQKATTAQISPGSNTSRTANTQPKKRTFDEAVAFAKEKIAREGIRPV